MIKDLVFCYHVCYHVCMYANAKFVQRSLHFCIKVFIPLAISQEFQLQPPASILAVLGETTTIPCGPPTSIPPATVQWTKDHRLLFGNRFVVDGTNLSVVDTQLSDRGMYYCTATNPLTMTSVTSQGVNITVKGELVLTTVCIGIFITFCSWSFIHSTANKYYGTCNWFH